MTAQPHAPTTNARLRYPDAPLGDVVDDYHGTIVADPYRWLEDTDAQQTREWITAQNRLTRDWLDSVGVAERIRARLAALEDHPRSSVPWREGERWFQLRNPGLADQDVLWTMDAPDAHGRVLLDPNLLSADGTVALTATAVSRDGRWLAYATSTAGSDWMTWRICSVDDGVDLADELHWSKFSGAAWAPDGSGFFYARYDPPDEADSPLRNQRLWFHRRATSQDEDILVYERPDQPEWGFDPVVPADGRLLVVQIWQGTDHRNRVYVADLASFDRRGEAVGLQVVPLLDDFDAGYHLVETVGDTLLFHTDADAPRGSVIAVDRHNPTRRQEIIGQASATLERAELFGGRLVALYLDDARHRVRRFLLDGSDDGEVMLPAIGSVAALSGKPEDADFFCSFETFAHPRAVLRIDLSHDRVDVLVAPGLASDPEDYRTEQVFVDSRDGTRVPMFVTRHRDTTVPAPTLLYGYGGFGISLTPTFRIAWLVWLELGGQLAVANLRGGGEYGQEWHDAGRLAAKQNVFDDAIACAETLVKRGLVTPRQLALTGASNGGLLAGAVLTQRPDLLGACVAEVGVLDMLRFHRFTIGWAWTSDYGSAEDPEQFKTLLAYSPLHNVRPGTSYPATLLTTGDHDDRVVPAHSLKFAAALQAAQAGDAPVLIRIQTDAGHGAGKPTRLLIEERADVLTFLVGALGLQTTRDKQAEETR